jgi:hypothetical protein
LSVSIVVFGAPTIFGRIANLIWFLVCWFTLVGLVCAVVGGFYFYGHVDESIRTQVEERLAQLYPQFNVKVAGAKLIEREGFEIRGVSLGTQGAAEPFLFVDEILVRCRPSLEDLLQKNPRVKEVIVRHAKLQAIQNDQGIWNFADLFQLRQSEMPVPRITLENGSVRIPGREGANLDFVNLNAQVMTDGGNESKLLVDLTCTGNHLQRVVARCQIDRLEPNWIIQGRVGDAAISPKLQRALPTQLARHLAPLTGLEARTHIDFQIIQDSQQYPPRQFHIHGQLAEGRWTHKTLAFPITDLTGRFQLTHASHLLENVRGRYGDATIQVTARRDGVAVDSPMQVRGKITRLRVDQGMIAQLPIDWQSKWQKYRPLGLIDTDFQLDFVQGHWVPQADIHCRDVSFTWDKHPYPIDRAAGEVAFRGGHCTFELHSISEKQPVRFLGDVHSPGEDWTGWVEAFVDKPIPLDERVLTALGDSTQTIVRAFEPRGAITMFARTERQAAHQEPYRRLIVDLHRGSVRHRNFPYPLQNVSAHIERYGNNWRFTDMVGVNDGAILKCEGDWQAEPNGAGTLKLNFAGSDLPLEEELRTALSPTAQHLWAQLRPQGTLDSVQATFRYQLPSRETQLVVRAHKLPEQQSARGHSLTVNPTAFPYRVDNVSGSVIVSNDELRIEKLRGTHGKVALTTSGVAKVSRDGPWSMTFSPIVVDRLRVDDELTAALPPQIRSMLTQIPFTGPIALGGRVDFAGNARNISATRASWNLDVDLENGRLNFDVPLEHISGAVHLDGRIGANQGYCRGDLNIDSLICQGVQLSNVRGPLWVDRNRILLGKKAQPVRPGLPPQRLTAKVFGGNLGADVEMMMSQDGQFQVAASLENARAVELTRRVCDATMSGQAWANLNLTGNLHGSHTWSGNGTMQLRNTTLYKLPAVLSLLRTISTGSADRTAFTSCDTAFHLKGKHVYFDQLDLLGDALTLKGVGEMDNNRELNLNFYTMMGREDSYFPALRPLLGMASRRFMLVHVDGNMNNPNMTREVLPGLNDTLRQLFPETVSPSEPTAETQIASELPGDSNVQQATHTTPADVSRRQL